MIQKRENTAKNMTKSFQKFEWEYNVEIAFIHSLFPFFSKRIFKEKYQVDFPKVVFGVNRLTKQDIENAINKDTKKWVKGGSYIKKNEIGFSNEIKFSPLVLGSETYISAVLFHEMVHMFQSNYDPRQSKTHWYHDTRFREMSEHFVPTDKKGHFLGVTEAFLLLLDDFGIKGDRDYLINTKVLEKILIKEKKEQVKTKMKKWSCNCKPKPVNIRCAVMLEAICQKCNTAFEIQE